MASIKDAIKEHLENLIIDEEQKLKMRIDLNQTTGADNYDNTCEKNFIDKLKEFVYSI